MSRDKTNQSFAYLVWGLGAFGFFYAWFQRVIPSVMVDHLMADFAVNGVVLGTLSSLYFYVYAAMQLPVGALIDRWGPGVPYASALILAAVGSVLFATTDTIEIAYLGRIMIGAGSAFAWVAVLKISALHFAPSRFAMLSGAGMFFGMFGGFCGQVVGGTLVDAVGWRTTMWGLAVTGMVLSIAVFALVGRQKSGGTTNSNTPTMKEILITFTSALRQPQVWLVSCGGAIAAAPVFIFGALWGVPFLMQIHGLPRPLAALLTATMLIGWGLGAFFSGWLSDRMGQRRKPLIAGIVVAMASLSAAIYLPDLSTTTIAALMLVGGLGSGVIILIFAISGDLAPDAARGSAFAFTNMLMILSGAIFQPVTGLLLDLNWNGVTENSARLYDFHAYQIAFLLIPITSIVGMLMILLSHNTEKDAGRPA